MARAFDDGSTQYIEHAAAAVLSSEPLTMAAWFNSDDITANQALITICDKTGGASRHWFIRVSGGVGGDPVQAFKLGSPASTTTGYSANTDHHACAVFTSTTSRDAYIDGGSKGNNTTSAVNPIVGSTQIGIITENSSDILPFSGNIWEAAIWNVALVQAEITILAAGFSPLFVRPASIVAYWPLIGRYSPEIDRVGGFDMTLINTPTTASHGRIIYPAPMTPWYGAFVAPTFIQPPRSMHQFRLHRAA